MFWDRSKKKLNFDKINKATKSFLDTFKKDEDNLEVLNREVQDLITVAQFNNEEKIRFLSNIEKELAKHNISLDSIEKS